MGILTLLIDNIGIIFDLIDRCQASEAAGQIPEEAAGMPADDRMLWRLQYPGPTAIASMARAHLEDQGMTRGSRGYRRARREAIREIRAECRESTVEERQDILARWREERTAA